MLDFNEMNRRGEQTCDCGRCDGRNSNVYITQPLYGPMLDPDYCAVDGKVLLTGLEMNALGRTIYGIAHQLDMAQAAAHEGLAVAENLSLQVAAARSCADEMMDENALLIATLEARDRRDKRVVLGLGGVAVWLSIILAIVLS